MELGTAGVYATIVSLCEATMAAEDGAADSYKCSCESGWRGLSCENPTGCSGSPCGDHGTCTTNGGNHTCHCESGWAGDACDHGTGCDGNPCLNGGNCIADGGNHTCTCAAGYTGDQCEHDPCFSVSCPADNEECHVHGSVGSCDQKCCSTFCHIAYSGSNLPGQEFGTTGCAGYGKPSCCCCDDGWACGGSRPSSTYCDGSC